MQLADAADFPALEQNAGSAARMQRRMDQSFKTQFGGRQQCLDVAATIIAQQPKLAPHAAAMVANVAVDLGISPDSVNIKGKTNEKLGYLGRQEAIEAQAVVLVERAG